LKIGREVVIVADRTKCGVVSTAYLAPLSAIHTFITNREIEPDFVNALQERGIQVYLA
jgi:DeoR family transcriptional regulator of aga operon/DeoR family fructose operon transcriptional repressor